MHNLYNNQKSALLAPHPLDFTSAKIVYLND